MPKRKQKTDDEIEQLIGSMIDEAQNFIEESLEPDRQKATKYYMGRPFGNEEKGRSSVVMTEVRDTVMGQLWSLLRVFVGPERVVEYRAQQPEDEQVARQATDYANYVFMEDNPGAQILHAAFKDALVRRTGFVKWWWDESERVEEKEYTGLSDDDLAVLMTDEEVEVEVTSKDTVTVPSPETGEPMEFPIYDATITRTTKDGRLRVEEVPPEEILWNRSARKFPDNTRIVVHATMKTVDELVAMGYDEDVVRDHISSSPSGATARSAVSKEIREVGLVQTSQVEETGPAETKPVRYDEAYARADFDGEVKLWKMCFIGDSHKLMAKQTVSHVPIALFCPDPEPHTVAGRSTADDVMDIQRIQSDIARATLDSLAQVVDPATMVVEDAVEMKDLLNPERNRIVRMRVPDAVKEFRHTFVGGDTLPVMEFFDGRVEKRTGQSKASQGLDADVLQSTTKAAVAATLTKAQERISGIAFVFASGGMRQLFRGILKTITENQDRVRIIRLRNQYVPIDPRGWNADMDVIVNVGLGAGLVEDKMNLLAAVAAKQEQILSMLGPSEFVSLSHYRHTLARMVELGGWRNADEFYGEITPDLEQQLVQQMQQMAQGAAGGEDKATAEAYAQAENVKAQIQQMKNQFEAQMRQQELALRAEEIRLNDDRERDKQAADFVLAKLKLEIESGAKLQAESIKAQVEAYRADLDAETAISQAASDAMQAEAQSMQPEPEDMTNE